MRKTLRLTNKAKQLALVVALPKRQKFSVRMMRRCISLLGGALDMEGDILGQGQCVGRYRLWRKRKHEELAAEQNAHLWCEQIEHVWVEVW